MKPCPVTSCQSRFTRVVGPLPISGHYLVACTTCECCGPKRADVQSAISAWDYEFNREPELTTYPKDEEAKRIWKPLDLAPGYRLYAVEARFSNSLWNEKHIVASASPSSAAKAYIEQTAGTIYREDPIIQGHALNVLQPKSWEANGPPVAKCPICGKWTLAEVDSRFYCTENGQHVFELVAKKQ